jgi:hypothetical protein
MRVRSGYVSNSSSSSFILMYRDDSKIALDERSGNQFACDFTVNDLLDIINRLNTCCSECTEIVVDGYENVESYLTKKNECGYSNYDEEYSNAILKKMEQNRNNYPDAMVLSIEYRDKAVKKIVNAFIKSGEFILLDENKS